MKNMGASKISDATRRIAEAKNISSPEMGEVFDEIMSGKAGDSEIEEFLSALADKGETIDEIAGAAESMRKRAVFIDSGAARCVDTCGTGGDGLGTFNISTVSAFVAAGAGARVAKHGNRAASGKCGSADLLAKLGFNLDVSAPVMEQCLQETGIAFLFSPKMHPAMRHAAAARKALGRRTIFNILGPLVNPANAKGRVLGVFSPAYTEIFARALLKLGCERAFVVHGGDGMDEITLCAPTRVSEILDGTIKTYELDPRSFGMEFCSLEELEGGGADENAKIARSILDGSSGRGARDICLLNAGAAIVAGGVSKSLAEGIILARESLESGRAAEKLDELVEYSNQ